jgi:hypothetical protein
LADYRERVVMSVYSPVTDTDLARARSDPAFRQKLLTQSLETLLSRMQKLRGSASNSAGGGAKQLREGVELAVRLAELIQNADGRPQRH